MPEGEEMIRDFRSMGLTRTVACARTTRAEGRSYPIGFTRSPSVVVPVSPVSVVATPAPPPLALVVIIIIAPTPVGRIDGRRSDNNWARNIHGPGRYINRLGLYIHRLGRDIDRRRFGIDDTGNSDANVDIYTRVGSGGNCEKCATERRNQYKLLHFFLNSGRA